MTVGGLSGLFSRALDGLNVSSKGMTVIANNIANVNTEGYARQTLMQGTRGIFGDGSLGGGVTSLGIAALIDPFIERQLVNESAELGFLDSRSSTLSQIEGILSETNEEGLGGAMNKFFNSISELSQDASSGVLRQSVRERGVALASQFRQLHTQLQSLRRNVSNSIDTRLGGINSTLSDIADLNRTIATSADDSTKQELKAHRNLLLRSLSHEVGVNYFEKEDGTVSVQLSGGGATLVDRFDSAVLSASDDLSPGGEMTINSTIPNGNGSIPVTSYIQSGRLGGLLRERNTTLNDNIENLNELAFQFVDQFNTIHQTGYGLDGNTARNFFTALPGADNAAALIEVDPNVIDDLNVIGAAGADPTVNVGDNAVALQLSGLRDALSMDGGTQTFTESYSNMVSSIGVTTGQVTAQFTSKATLLNRLEIQRENVSGVDINEEAADLIRYQKAFEGSARVMSVANQMLDTLLRI